MVWRLVEEIFNPINLEEVKRKLDLVIGNVLNLVHRDKVTLAVSHACRKEVEESQKKGKDKMTGVFLEENLVLSMLHKDQVVSDSLIGGFEPSLELENTVSRSPMVRTLGRCNEEANNLLSLVMQAHSSFHINTNSKVVDYRELVYNGPKYPSGFEEYIGVVGPSTRGQVHCTSNKNLVLESSLAKGNEAYQSYGESHCSMSNSIKKVSQPALLDLESIL